MVYHPMIVYSIYIISSLSFHNCKQQCSIIDNCFFIDHDNNITEYYCHVDMKVHVEVTGKCRRYSPILTQLLPAVSKIGLSSVVHSKRKVRLSISSVKNDFKVSETKPNYEYIFTKVSRKLRMYDFKSAQWSYGECTISGMISDPRYRRIYGTRNPYIVYYQLSSRKCFTERSPYVMRNLMLDRLTREVFIVDRLFYLRRLLIDRSKTITLMKNVHFAVLNERNKIIFYKDGEQTLVMLSYDGKLLDKFEMEKTFLLYAFDQPQMEILFEEDFGIVYSMNINTKEKYKTLLFATNPSQFDTSTIVVNKQNSIHIYNRAWKLLKTVPLPEGFTNDRVFAII